MLRQIYNILVIIECECPYSSNVYLYIINGLLHIKKNKHTLNSLADLDQ